MMPRQRVVNVRDFGAKGDQKTDDTAAIQAALDYATGRVRFPSGMYLIRKTLRVGKSVIVGGHDR